MTVDTKAIYDPATIIEATVRPWEASTSAQHRNSGRDALIARHSHYVYICADKIAQAVAASTIRLYIDKKASRRRGVKSDQRAPLTRKQREWLTRGTPMLGPGVKATQHAQAAGDDAEQVIDHPALTLLDRPNPVLAGHDYTWLQEVFLSLTGTAFDSLILERGGGVRELWWLFPQWVSIQPDQEELIGGYWYGRDASNRTWLDRDEVLYMRQPSPFDPYYGMGPLAACLSAVDRYNALDRQMFKRSKRDAKPDMLVRTGADSWPPQEQVDQIREQFRRLAQMPEDQAGVIVVGGNGNVTPMMFPPKDLGNVEEAKAARDVILHTFGVPESMITVEDVNRANGLVGHPQFMQYTVLPRLNRRADHLNQLLPHFGFRPGEAWFAYDNPVPEDRAYTTSRNTAYVAGGIMTPNEARISEGLDPIEDESADRLLVNGVPLGQTIGFGLPSAGSVADAPEPEQQPQAGADATAGAAEAAAQGTAAVQDTALNGAQVEALINLASLVAQGQLPKDAARQIALAAFPGIDPAKVEAIFASIDEGAAEPEPEPEPPAAQEGADDEQAADAGEDQGEGEKGQSHADLWAKWRDPCECGQGIDHKAADPRFDRKPVRGFVRSLRGYYAAKAEAVASKIEAAEPFVKAGPSDFLERLGIGARDFDDLLKAASSSYIQRGIESGAKEGLDTLRDLLGEAMPAIDIDLSVNNPAIRAEFERHEARFVRSVNDTDEAMIRQVIADGIERGESNADIARMLRERLSDIGQSKAEMIARTETNRATTLGEQASWKASGVVARKRWLLAPGACEYCRALAAQVNEVPIDEPFLKKGQSIGGLQLDFEDVDGPPLHPNDRCALAPVIGE